MSYSDKILDVLNREKNGRGCTFKEIVLTIGEDVNLSSVSRNLRCLMKSGLIEKKAYLIKVYKVK